MSTTAYTDVKIQEAGVEITVSVPSDSAAAALSESAGVAPPTKRARKTCAICCNGQRDKTAFVSIKQFNTNHLVSDLHFLEEVEHNAERARTHLNNVVGSHSHHVKSTGGKRKAGTAFASSVNEAGKLNSKIDGDELLHQNERSDTGGGPRLPTELLQKRTRREKLLLDAASSRGTKLVLLSSGMQRRQENTSYWNRKEDVVYWRVGWQRSGGGVHIMDGADERKTVAVLANELNGFSLSQSHRSENAMSKSCSAASGSDNSSGMSNSNQIRQSCFRYYLEKTPCPANDRRYYNLGIGDIPLKDALKDRTLLEHPIFKVCGPGEDAPQCVV
eukprot:g2659.t1